MRKQKQKVIKYAGKKVPTGLTIREYYYFLFPKGDWEIYKQDKQQYKNFLSQFKGYVVAYAGEQEYNYMKKSKNSPKPQEKPQEKHQEYKWLPYSKFKLLSPDEQKARREYFANINNKSSEQPQEAQQEKPQEITNLTAQELKLLKGIFAKLKI